MSEERNLSQKTRGMSDRRQTFLNQSGMGEQFAVRKRLFPQDGRSLPSSSQQFNEFKRARISSVQKLPSSSIRFQEEEDSVRIHGEEVVLEEEEELEELEEEDEGPRVTSYGDNSRQPRQKRDFDIQNEEWRDASGDRLRHSEYGGKERNDRRYRSPSPEFKRPIYRNPYREPLWRDSHGKYKNEPLYGPERDRYGSYRDFSYESPRRSFRDYRRDNYEDSMESALEDAWNDGYVDVLELGKVVYNSKLAGTFSDRALQRFIESKVHRMRFHLSHSSSFESISMNHGLADNFTAYMEGNNLLNSIFLRSQKKIGEVFQRPSAAVAPSSQTTSVLSDLVVSPHFLTKLYHIQGDEVFRDLNLTTLVSKWAITGNTAQTALVSIYRKVFQHVCKFPPNIKKYTIRITIRGNPHSNLLDLPSKIRGTLEELGMGLVNLDHEELSDEPPEEYKNSRFYQELGDSLISREETFSQMKSQRREWLQHIPVLLRNALRDVRLHSVTQKVENGMESFIWKRRRERLPIDQVASSATEEILEEIKERSLIQ